MEAAVFDASKPDPVERLARIEGSSNFMSLLAGIEAGPDTTEDMAALAFSRSADVTPEILEAYIAKSSIFKLPLMSMVFNAICTEIEHKRGIVKAKDKPWMQGAVADAFMLVRDGRCKPSRDRAKRFRVGHETYESVRKLAGGIFTQMIDEAETAWVRARFRT